MGVVMVVKRADGKLHPAGGRLPEAERMRVVNLAHALRCRDGLSYRQVVAGLADEGLRVSLGSAFAWVNGAYTCRYCRAGDETSTG